MTTDYQRNVRDPVDVEVGARLKALRLQNRLTQVELANAIGVTFQQVQKYEKGHNRLAASTLAKVASALNCRIADFYETPDQGGAPDLPQAMAELSALYERMAVRQRDALMNTARALVEISR
jgi:transcriptional regulator with XRE-family HTH domain